MMWRQKASSRAHAVGVVVPKDATEPARAEYRAIDPVVAAQEYPWTVEEARQAGGVTVSAESVEQAAADVIRFKACSICDRMRPLSAFHVDAFGLYGRHHRCKDCKGAYNERYRSAAVATKAVDPIVAALEQEARAQGIDVPESGPGRRAFRTWLSRRLVDASA